jgi:curved DNA-binding protein CbpA
MKKEPGFEDEIALLEKEDLSAKELIKIKRKFAMKYHPDKFPGESEEMAKKRAEAEAIFKQYNALIEVIELMIK